MSKRFAFLLIALPSLAAVTIPVIPWKANDRIRPAPPEITPATASTQEQAGTLTRLATITGFLNGVLVQDNVALTGPTAHMKRPPYKRTLDRLPLELQDHNHPVRFRNIWIRELAD